MNVLFLSLNRFEDLEVRHIYTDLMREFIRKGHYVYMTCCVPEDRVSFHSHLVRHEGYEVLKISTLPIVKTNAVKKGIGMLLLEPQFGRAIRRHWGDVRFDLVIYATPPITFNRVIARIARRTGAHKYLLLKDIFPQNAVDLGMMREGSLIHRFFRRKERRLYRLSDRIGCMSPANCRYVIEHNPEVDAAKVELAPNSNEPIAKRHVDAAERAEVLERLGIPADRRLFIYGGNLGKPQGLDFLLRVIAENESSAENYILVIGSGTEYPRIERWFAENSPRSACLRKYIPKADYDALLAVCDVGLIFLDPRFTIPNFPSRLLSYLENSMPVLLATDVNTDMGSIAEEAGFGLWAENGDLERFMANMRSLTAENIAEMGAKGRQFLLDNYTVDRVTDTILRGLPAPLHH